MKQLYLYIRLASVLLLLSACAQDNMPGLDEESATGASDDILIIHTVEQTGFRANQSTRSSYTAGMRDCQSCSGTGYQLRARFFFDRAFG